MGDRGGQPTLTIHITGPDQVTELSGSPIDLVAPFSAGTGCPAGWAPIAPCYGLDLTSLGIVVTGDFFVILNKTAVGSRVYEDTATSGSLRSYSGNALPMTVMDNKNVLIRVDIDPIYPPSGPVGGFMEPVNKLAVFAPYLALFGVIGAVAVVFWKRPDN